MNIIGKKIILRAVEEQDLPLLKDLMNDPDIEGKVVGWSFPISSSGHLSWFSNLRNDDKILRCMIESNANEVVGTCVLSGIDWKNRNAKIHIKLSGEFQGKGFGKEAIKAMVLYAFKELGLMRISATVIDENLVSIATFEKCAFKREGILRKSIYKNGCFHDEVVLSILNEECNGSS